MDLIVGISRQGSGFVITDSTKREHVAKDEAELGRVIAGLLGDAALPRIDQAPVTGAMRVRNGAVEIATGVLPPSLAPAAAPLVDALSHLAVSLRNRRRAAQSQAPAPTPAPSRQPATTRRVPARIR